MLNAQDGAANETRGRAFKRHQIVEVLLGRVARHRQKRAVNARVQRVQLVCDRRRACQQVGCLAFLFHDLFDLHQFLAEVAPDFFLQVARHHQPAVRLGIGRHQQTDHAFQVRCTRLLGAADPLEQEPHLVHHVGRHLVPCEVAGDLLLGLDGAVDSRRQAAVHQHLGGCPQDTILAAAGCRHVEHEQVGGGAVTVVAVVQAERHAHHPDRRHGRKSLPFSSRSALYPRCQLASQPWRAQRVKRTGVDGLGCQIFFRRLEHKFLGRRERHGLDVATLLGVVNQCPQRHGVGRPTERVPLRPHLFGVVLA